MKAILLGLVALTTLASANQMSRSEAYSLINNKLDVAYNKHTAPLSTSASYSIGGDKFSMECKTTEGKGEFVLDCTDRDLFFGTKEEASEIAVKRTYNAVKPISKTFRLDTIHVEFEAGSENFECSFKTLSLSDRYAGDDVVDLTCADKSETKKTERVDFI